MTITQFRDVQTVWLKGPRAEADAKALFDSRPDVAISVEHHWSDVWTVKFKA